MDDGRSGLEIASLAFLLGGAFMSALGIVETWRTHRKPGDRIWGREIDWVKARARSVAGWVRRIFKRRRDVTLRGVGGIPTGVMIGGARLQVGMPALPSVDDPEFPAKVHAQIERAFMLAQKVEADVADEVQDRAAADDLVRADLGARIATVEERQRTVTIGGLRFEITGLGLVLLGTILGFIAQ